MGKAFHEIEMGESVLSLSHHHWVLESRRDLTGRAPRPGGWGLFVAWRAGFAHFGGGGGFKRGSYDVPNASQLQNHKLNMQMTKVKRRFIKSY